MAPFTFLGDSVGYTGEFRGENSLTRAGDPNAPLGKNLSACRKSLMGVGKRPEFGKNKSNRVPDTQLHWLHFLVETQFFRAGWWPLLRHCYIETVIRLCLRRHSLEEKLSSGRWKTSWSGVTSEFCWCSGFSIHFWLNPLNTGSHFLIH